MTGPHDSLQDEIRKGGQIQAPEDALTQAAQALGHALYVVDCGRAKSKSAVLRAIATAVDFPEFFGSNLDALLDCLTTTVLDQPAPGAVVLLKDINQDEPALAEHVDDIITTFADAAEYVRDNGKVLAFARL